VIAQLGLGVVLAAAGWLLTRRSAGAPWRRPAALLLDALWPALGFALALAASARPVLAGLVILSLAAGLMLADLTKRAALREPVVFSDLDEFVQLFRHPQLYLPFAGPALVIGGALAAFGALALLLALEPPAWPWSPWPIVVLLVLVVLAVAAILRAPLLGIIVRALKRFPLEGDPTHDARALGLLAMQFTYGMIARAERPARRGAAAPPAAPTPGGDAGQPIVLIQGESFFDARRLHAGVPRDLLPGYDSCRASALRCGRLSVPGWGANTMRTEFAALSGLSQAELGFDRFNPYYAFARRQPVASLAWTLRAQGYRTVCLHPFDRRFFRRDIVMTNLGFDEFLGLETFADAPRVGRYVGDEAVGRRILELIDAAGPKLFVFAITMENHGPWDGARTAIPAAAATADLGADAAALHQYLDGLRSTDRMIELLATRFRAQAPGLLGFYGDHLPSLPRIFDRTGYDDARTDYFIWHPAGGRGEPADLAAHELGRALLECLGAGRPGPGGFLVNGAQPG
jgi:hypothetical protein